MNTFDQKGFNVTDLMGNHYLFCDPFDAGIEVTPTHLTYVTDALYCRIFLLELCRMGSLSESLRDLYKYARPHNYQLYKLSDWDIIDQLIHMLVTEELKVWQLKDGLWDNAPEHIGNDVPMAGSASRQNQTSEQVNGVKKSPVVSSSNIDEKTLDSKKQPAKYEPSGAMLGESVVPNKPGVKMQANDGPQIPPLSSYEDRIKLTPINNGRWTGQRGESNFIFDNPDIQKILPDGIAYKNGYPDFSPVTLHEVRLNNLISTDRDVNFKAANMMLAEKLGVKERDISKFMSKQKYTWHEVEDMRTLQLVPSFIHTGKVKSMDFGVKYGHFGGVGERTLLEMIQNK